MKKVFVKRDHERDGFPVTVVIKDMKDNHQLIRVMHFREFSDAFDFMRIMGV